MILRRLALFAGLAVALAATQLPAFVQQYRQRLGGAVDQLAAVIARFDADCAQQGLTEAAGIDRLRANDDPLVRRRGAAMADDAGRLQSLREAQAAFRDAGPVARLATFATHYDGTVAHGAFAEFEPAVPTTPEALVLGALGFIVGGGSVHAAGRLAGRPRRLRARTA